MGACHANSRSWNGKEMHRAGKADGGHDRLPVAHVPQAAAKHGTQGQLTLLEDHTLKKELRHSGRQPAAPSQLQHGQTLYPTSSQWSAARDVAGRRCNRQAARQACSKGKSSCCFLNMPRFLSQDHGWSVRFTTTHDAGAQFGPAAAGEGERQRLQPEEGDDGQRARHAVGAVAQCSPV